jgi:hypothetical protein
VWHGLPAAVSARKYNVKTSTTPYVNGVVSSKNAMKNNLSWGHCQEDILSNGNYVSELTKLSVLMDATLGF